MHTRKRTSLEIICCLLCALILILRSTASIVYAEEIKATKDNLDIMFIMDYSGSMNSNDKEKVAPEMVKAFVDTVHSENVRIGFVAYNDRIISSSSPVPVVTSEQRVALKTALDEARYSGNTDIGLALKYACELSGEEQGRRRMFVLISDGESDLGGSTTGRTLEDSVNDLEYATSICEEATIPIYTVAFGSFGGSKEVLENIAQRTGGLSYTAQNPEFLIEVLYGILNNNLAYKIQPLSAGRYASGNQEISCTLNESYLSEIDVLLISPQKIGTTSIQYGDTQVSMTSTNYYTVGKISSHEINKNIKELTIHTDTTDGQQVKVYVIGYRNLEPILSLEPVVPYKDDIPYQIYFKDKDGNLIQDEAFYQKFQWTQNLPVQHPVEVKDGYLQGQLPAMAPGNYTLEGQLSDELGSYQFQTSLTLLNTPPTGEVPAIKTTTLSKPIVWNLDDYFADAEGDKLQYSIVTTVNDGVTALLEEDQLTVNSSISGNYTLEILVSDGREAITCPLIIEVFPWWQIYWWILVAIVFIMGAIVWWLLQKTKTKNSPSNVEKENPYTYTGRLSIFITRTVSGYDIEPLIYNLFRLSSCREISLKNILDGCGVDEPFAGSDKILFQPGAERRLILMNHSNCTILRNREILMKGECFELPVNAKVDIIFEDEKSELTLHYKDLKPSEMRS